MERMDYTPNSNRFKEAVAKPDAASSERPKIKKVVNGVVKTKKASFGAKIFGAFVQEDPDTVRESLLMDVLVPATKKLITDIINNGLDMLFYSKTGVSRSQTPATRISYNSISSSGYSYQNQQPIQTINHSYNDIVLPSKRDAESVLQAMDELLSRYHIVSIADLYDLIGWNSQYTDGNYGWANLSSASIIRTRDGYLLKLPKAMQIN